MYLAHGERTDGNDQLLQAYTDRPWKKLHRVLLRLRAMLLPILTSVESPWDYKMNTISPVKRARVKGNPGGREDVKGNCGRSRLA